MGRAAWGTYKHIADRMRPHLTHLPGGTQLPSEAQLMRDHAVSRTTIRRALALLSDEGVVVSRPGIGWVRAGAPEQHRQTLSHRIAEHLRSGITTGALPSGAALPSESALTREHEASRGTVRQALAALESEGLIRTVHGKGRFVA